MTTIQLKDLHANPFRDLTRLPTKPEKVAVLKESIKETSFWDNIVCRKAPNGSGGYQLAYGHNRLQALRELKWDEVNIPVRDLDDTLMVKIMVRENHEEWGAYAEVDAEAARAVVAAFAEGKIRLPKVTIAGAAKGMTVRLAPSFCPTRISENARAVSENCYTVATLGKFLGWNETKTGRILNMLTFQEVDANSAAIDFTNLSPKQADAVVRETRRTERESGSQALAAQVGQTLANELRSTSGDPRGRGKADKRAVSTHTAKARANELMREARVTRRRAERQVKADKLNLQKEDRQVKQFLDACKAFGTAMHAAGKANSKFSPEAKRFTIRRLTEIGNDIVLLKGRLG